MVRNRGAGIVGVQDVRGGALDTDTIVPLAAALIGGGSVVRR